MNDTTNKFLNAQSKKYYFIIGVFVIILVSVIVAGILVFNRCVSRGILEAKNSFEESYENTRSYVEQRYKESVYKKEEKKHHIHNDVNIIIGTIKEISNLEVLKVSDLVYLFLTKRTQSPVQRHGLKYMVPEYSRSTFPPRNT